ncbi:hypothetical protein MC64_001875 [Aeromonas caviae]|nr:hypothetical protein MC64_001875 [Aeromonas caviae]RWT43910.1 hypothetical protein DN613_00780 [Aeromonas caviae]
MTQGIRTRLAVDLAQAVFIEEGAGALFVELYLPPALVALLHLDDVQLAQGLDRGVGVAFIAAEGLLVDADGPAVAAVVLAAIADALEMLNEMRCVERSSHVAIR